MSTQNPYRDGDPMVARVDAIESRVKNTEESLRILHSDWRKKAWEGWKWVGLALKTILLCGVLLGLAVFTSSFGNTARGNAQREALRWARVQWPATRDGDVYCETSIWWKASCYVYDPNRVSWRIHCDDDPPRTNEGCDSVAERSPMLGVPANLLKDAGADIETGAGAVHSGPPASNP